MKKITLLFLATILTFAMFLGSAPTTAYADTSYHAYMGIQSNTKDWIFRNAYDDPKYGFGTDAFKGLNSVSGTTLTPYAGTFTDAPLTVDGTYTVTLDNPDFSAEKNLSQLFVSTDIPLCDSVKVTNVIIAIDGKTVYTFDDAVINPDSKAYIQIVCLSLWNKEVIDKVPSSLPITKCEITFTISGLADAATTQVALKGFEFKDYSDHVVVISYTGSNEVVAIPSSVNGKVVTEIGANAFHNKDLSITKVTIPNTVTTIDKNAFYGCTKLKSITLPSSVTTIAAYAFYQTGLTSVTIPKSVTTIGDGAFGNCISCQKITVAKDNAKYIATDGVLFSKNKKTLVQYPAGMKITSYSVPSSVTTISGGAFAGCANLTKLTITKNVTTIGKDAFVSCKKLTIYAPSSSTAYKYAVKQKIKVKKN